MRVRLGQRSYPVRIGPGLLDALGFQAAGEGLSGRCAVIADETVLARTRERVEKALTADGFAPVFIAVKGGESAKTMAEAERIVGALVEARLDRGSVLFALGGGTIGDLAGFVAAIFMRGVKYVHVPTTLLAQVDSSVGGKVAVNHPLGKNLIGAFHQPSLVLADTALCETLPPREMWAGMAEVVKAALIADDHLFGRLEQDLEKLARNRNVDQLSDVVAWAVGIKAEIVARDETESGIRMLLNFGHTIGHALEAATDFGRWRHGEAIVLGMAAALHVSHQVGLLGFVEMTRVLRLLERMDVGASATDLDPRAVVEAALRDKKSREGKIRFVVLNAIGRAEVVDRVTETMLKESVAAIQGRAPAAAEGK